MAKIYFDLIQKGLKTIDDVPARWKDDVQALLNNTIITVSNNYSIMFL